MSMSDSFNNIPEHQKAEFLRHLEDFQMKDSLKMYTGVVDMCFNNCVTVSGWSGGFKSKNLEESESKCVCQCTEKFLKVTQRVGFRFTEYQAAKSSNQSETNSK